MRAMIINGYGDSDVLTPADIPTPEPEVQDVLVRLSYAAVNPADWKFRKGWGKRFPTYRESFPMILGLEGVGIVEQVGKGVSRCRPGDRVAMRCNLRAGLPGSYAQFAVTSQDAVARIPNVVSFVDAATIPVAGVTGYQAVVHAANVQKGMQVLVHGAAGAVGSFAVQCAAALGARVAGSCSAANAGYVLSMGAECAIDYAGDVECDALRWAPEGFDVLIDCVGMHTLRQPLDLLKPGGIDVRIVTLTDSDLESPTEAEAQACGKRAIVKVVDQATAAADMDALLAMLADGRLKAPEVAVMPLQDVGKAHDMIEQRKVRGKLLLQTG